MLERFVYKKAATIRSTNPDNFLVVKKRLSDHIVGIRAYLNSVKPPTTLNGAKPYIAPEKHEKMAIEATAFVWKDLPDWVTAININGKLVRRPGISTNTPDDSEEIIWSLTDVETYGKMLAARINKSWFPILNRDSYEENV